MEKESVPISDKSLEGQGSEECRIFCIFWNSTKQSYRASIADLVFVKTLVDDVSYEEVIKAMITKYEEFTKKKFDYAKLQGDTE